MDSKKEIQHIGVDKLNYDCDVDTLVIGSDEVFNCLQPYPVGYSKQLFGDGYAHSKIVSYAASFGSTRYEDLVDGMKGFLLQLVILLIGFTVFSKTWIPMLQFFLNKIQRKRVS